MLLYAVDTDWSSSDANDMYFLCLDVMSQVPNHTYSHIFPIFVILDLSLFCSQEYHSLVFSPLLIHHFISRSCLSATFLSRYLPLLSESTTGVTFLLPTFSGYGLPVYLVSLFVDMCYFQNPKMADNIQVLWMLQSGILGQICGLTLCITFIIIANVVNNIFCNILNTDGWRCLRFFVI